uniref:Holin n=1 Tax=viral metagenome TaxID=1070528 RepID=A0A6M3IG37_9ZZZZ
MNWSEIVVAVLGFLTVLLGGGLAKYRTKSAEARKLLKEVEELLANPNQKELQDVIDAAKALVDQ